MNDIPFPFPEQPPRTVKDIDPPVFHKMHKLDINENPFSYEKLRKGKLKDWHRIMAEMQVMGYPNRKIALELGVHEMSIARVQRDPIFKVHIKDLRKQAEENSVYDVAAHLNRVTEKTFRTLESLMESSESDNVRVTAAKEFADRISPKINRTESENKNIIYFESDTIKMLAENFKQSCDIDPKQLEGKSDKEIIEILEDSVELTTEDGDTFDVTLEGDENDSKGN